MVVYRYGTVIGDTFGRIFTSSTLGDADPATGPGPGDGERLNVLLVGVDSTRTRTETLTDTMMVASLDPVGHTVTPGVGPARPHRHPARRLATRSAPSSTH